MSDKPFDPTYAPEGCVAEHATRGCLGCCNENQSLHECYKRYGRYCASASRPDGHTAILVRKPSAPASSPLLDLLTKLVDVQKQLLDMAGKLSPASKHDVMKTQYELDEMLKKVREGK